MTCTVGNKVSLCHFFVVATFAIFVSVDVAHSLAQIHDKSRRVKFLLSMQELADCYVATQRQRPHERNSSRNLLQRRHVVDFPDGHKSLFHSFAQTVCRANAVPRKELWETWATALYIQEYILNVFQDTTATSSIGRIADLACGHGLLSWALLVLLDHDDIEHEADSHRGSDITAICIDKRMPLSAEKLADAMIHDFPQLSSRWDFVESKLDAVTTTAKTTTTANRKSPTTTTLLCGIHACGTLSDQILSLAIAGNMPVALVPCCHTQKSLDESERKEFDNLTRIQALTDVVNRPQTLASFVNLQRTKRLEQAGYQVIQRYIPEQFTPENTILLATPPLQKGPNIGQSPIDSTNKSYLKTRLPPLVPSVPIDNSEESRALVKTLAGRKAAQQRKSSPPPTFCISLAMPREKSLHVTSSKLVALIQGFLPSMDTVLQSTCVTSAAETIISMNVKVEYADQEAYWHSQSEQYFRTFKVTIFSCNNDGMWLPGVGKDVVKNIQFNLRHEIPLAFPGCITRS